MVRHNRSAAFTAAWRAASGPAPRLTTAREDWSASADDPNDPVVIAVRAKQLAAAWRPMIPDRTEYLEARCRDRRVLDIGCVAHAAERLDSPDWLHGRLATVAADCVGVDILPSGVDAVRAAGYDAVVHDLTTGLGPLAARAPFEVIVAGELIEHVPDLDMVMRVAEEGLADDGVLVLTTPNPYAPHRVRAGQRGIVWENVDHVSYLFPSGIAELASRRGLVLREAATVDDGPDVVRLPLRRWVARTVLGSHWRNVGLATAPASGARSEAGRQVRVDGGLPAALARRLAAWRGRFVGETAVYVIGKP